MGAENWNRVSERAASALNHLSSPKPVSFEKWMKRKGRRNGKWNTKQNLDYSECGKAANRGKLESEVHKYIFKEKEEGIEWINDKDQKEKS